VIGRLVLIAPVFPIVLRDQGAPTTVFQAWARVPGEGGRKNFTGSEGEAVRLELPGPRGSASLQSRDGSYMRANYEELFTNHQTSIIIKVARN
jgi:hypothetical protein